MIERPQGGDPQFSPDGEWWWNGHEWLPARDAPHGKVGTSIIPAPVASGDQAVLITIGNIACTRTQVITPGGSYPLAGTTWIVSNNTITTSSVSTLGVVLCIIFILACLLGLLFLLMKDTKTQGTVQVSVQGNGLYHAVQIPVSNPLAVGQIEQQVNYVRSLVATLAATHTP